jgi:hypothetical protein
MGRMGARAGAVLLVAVLSSPAFADVLPIGGIFGNNDGCRLFATGRVDGDAYMLLTPDTFSSYGTGCDFESLASTDGPVFTVSATCSAEGEAGVTTDTVRIIDHGSDGYAIQFDGLEEWGPMTACPPVDLGGSSSVVQL